MNRVLRFASEASVELDSAAKWYEENRRGLGTEFLNSIEAVLGAIQRTTMLFRLVHCDVRRALVKRFPFAIYFREESEFVDILAVFHTKRDPKSWQRRLF